MPDAPTRPAPPSVPGRSRTLGPPLVALALATVFALAWNDALPGGWRLRGGFEPHALAARRDQARRSAARVLVFLAENPSVAPGAVAFLGSSTIERFPLATSFPGRPCLERGIGNESAPELERRVAASLPPVPLGGAVVFTGRVDFRSGVPAPELRRRVEGVVTKLRALHPEAPIVLLGLLPGRDLPPAELERLARANAELRDLAARERLRFVETARPPLCDASGSLSEALSADALHLNTGGYDVLARWILEEGGELATVLAP